VPRRPVPITIACALVAVQALVLLTCAILVLANTGGGLATMGVTSAIFFLVCAAGLGLCARSLWLLQSWARAPIVLAQLIELGLAWNARHAAPALAIALAVLSVVALVCIFHPRSIAALSAADNPQA
jgi:hypothetical protein